MPLSPFRVVGLKVFVFWALGFLGVGFRVCFLGFRVSGFRL